MEPHLEESLRLLTKALEEADPDEFLEDFLKFQEKSQGRITVDELIDTFDIDKDSILTDAKNALEEIAEFKQHLLENLKSPNTLH